MAGTGDNIDDVQTRFLEEVSKPETLTRLLQMILPHVRQDQRNIAYILAQTDRFGHLAMEPFFLRSIFGDAYDNFILVMQARETERVNRALFDMVTANFTVIENADEILRMMGVLNNGIGHIGPVDLALISPVALARNFSKFVAGGGKPRFLEPDAALLEKGAAFLERTGVDPADKFVVLHARDMSYMPEVAMKASNRLRCATIANYRSTIDWLVEQGYWVFRIGDTESPQLDHPSSRVVDVPFLADYDDFMDVFLLARCDFALVCSSGPETLIRAFGRPSLNVNLPFNTWFVHLPNDLYIFKHFKNAASGQILSYAEILERRLPHVEDYEHYASMGLSFEENTPEEILEATKDMVRQMREDAAPETGGQARFAALGATYGRQVEADPAIQARLIDCYAYANGWGAVAPSYLRLNPDFVGEV